MTEIKRLLVSRGGVGVAICEFAEIGEVLQNLLLLNPDADFAVCVLDDDAPGVVE